VKLQLSPRRAVAAIERKEDARSVSMRGSLESRKGDGSLPQKNVGVSREDFAKRRDAVASIFSHIRDVARRLSVLLNGQIAESLCNCRKSDFTRFYRVHYWMCTKKERSNRRIVFNVFHVTCFSTWTRGHDALRAGGGRLLEDSHMCVRRKTTAVSACRGGGAEEPCSV